MMKIYYRLTLFLLMGILASCTQFNEFDNIEDVNSDPEYALPLISANFSIGDVLDGFEENNVLFIDPDGLIRFKYSGDVLTKSTDEVFAAINATLGQDVILPLVTDTFALPFTFPDGLEVDRMDLNAGQFLYSFKSKHPSPVTINLRVPQFTKDGEELSYQLDFPAYSGTGDAIWMTNFFAPTSLDGYVIQPAEDGFLYVIKEVITEDGEPGIISEAGVGLQDLAFSYAEGYLGNNTYDESRDTIHIDFFDKWINGDIYFEDPTITIFFENSFGVPTRSVVNIFEVFTVLQDVLPLESEFITDGIDFPFPTLDEIGEVKYKEFVFNKDNSNIAEILGAGPLALDYDVDAFTNPESDPDIRGFITDSSYYKVRIEVELPLYGKAINFAATDTFDIDLTSFDAITEAEFKLIADNELPMEIDGQVYFQDESGVVIDSLFADGATRLVEAAPVDGEGNASGIVSKINYIPVPPEHFESLKKASQLILLADFSTYNEGEVSAKVLADQTISIRMGLKVQTK
jgi:hypothetical protein